jgi:16S rRNA U516 pseudouridylate synthase RsuA-like enzyme
MRLFDGAHTYSVDIKGNILSSTIQALAKGAAIKGRKNKQVSFAGCLLRFYN